MIAARRGHVFVLEQQGGGDISLAYDANSGGTQLGFTLASDRSASWIGSLRFGSALRLAARSDGTRQACFPNANRWLYWLASGM